MTKQSVHKKKQTFQYSPFIKSDVPLKKLIKKVYPANYFDSSDEDYVKGNSFVTCRSKRRDNGSNPQRRNCKRV